MSQRSLTDSSSKSSDSRNVESDHQTSAITLREQLGVAIAKQVECYERVMKLNEELKGEIQLRHKAESEVKRLAGGLKASEAQLAEALEQLSQLQLELSRARQEQSGSWQDKLKQMEIMQQMMQQNRALDIDLKALQDTVTRLDTQITENKLKGAIKDTWIQLAEGLELKSAEVTEKLEHDCSEAFLSGVLMAFELILRKADDIPIVHQTNPSLSLHNPLLPHSLTLSRFDCSQISEAPSDCSCAIWPPRETSATVQRTNSTQPSTSPSTKQREFIFNSDDTCERRYGRASLPQLRSFPQSTRYYMRRQRNS